ncbi:DUF2339 domain-containing protein [Pelomonas sp. V22]|uniref:DUF2339 domain-containing protein n=1 Tax=Pelomonas sp. V22 TaxID=2822139 RepID=UPI0024A84354|nr:DUF2339 domain-containing protein [Pelomonas sp. V22]MDI4635725.1 DUF2339 domain-containing protein [Pelomonas sp. V22]
MAWIWGLAGFMLAWFIKGLFGSTEGALAVLAAVGAGLLGRLQLRVTALQKEVEALKKEPRAARVPPEATMQRPPEALPVPVPAAVPASVPMPQPQSEPEAALAQAHNEGDTGPDTVPMPLPSAPAPAPRPRPAPRVDEQEHLPSITSSLGASLQAWLRGGNTIVRAAVLILFIGVAFLLRYASEHVTVPIEVRLAGVVLGGVILTGLGLRLTPNRRGYGLSLQGAGLGIVYLALFAAYRLYQLLPSGLSFGLLAAMAVITTVLALRQDALPLAVLGFGGAFLAPVLTSTGQGSHVALFGYYLLLNLAIAAIARRKAWKLLNLEGFLFTFGIASAWGLRGYGDEKFWSVEPFLIAHFLLYLFITVQYALRLTEERAAPGLPLVDGGLLFGTPIVAFGLQAGMLKGQPLALAFSAAALAGLYLFLGQLLWRRVGERLVLLIEGLAALGLVFLALVMPLALDARWTGAAWALQGLGVLWVALRQRRWWAAGLALLLQWLACLSFWSTAGFSGGHWLFLNSGFLALLLPVLAALCSAQLLQRARQGDETLPPPLGTPMPEVLMLTLGLGQLWAGGIAELLHWQQQTLDEASLVALWSAALAGAAELLRRRLAWPALLGAARVLMLPALLASLTGWLVGWSFDSGWHRYAASWGWAEAVGLLLLGGWMLRKRRSAEDSAGPAAGAEQIALAWFAVIHGGSWLYSLAAHAVARHEGWTPAAAILLPTLLCLALLARIDPPRWPLLDERWLTLYRRALLRPWAALLVLWVLGVNLVCDARMAPLSYLPLLNPLDLGHGLALLYALKLGRETGNAAPRWLLPGLVFWWLNSLLVRSLHHWGGAPLWLDGALSSGLVLTGLTVLWTLTALVLMSWATRRAAPAQARPIWMVGAVLLGAVVLKLFLVDLSSLSSLMRIVSFMAVGLLMLVIGYVAPLPPAAQKEAA